MSKSAQFVTGPRERADTASMIVARILPPDAPSLAISLPCRELYFFNEKNTGLPRFHVEAGPDGLFPVEEAAGLLAMHCMVLGQSPQDYIVTVQAAQDSLGGLAGKVEKLLLAGHSVSRAVKLTRRQDEVLSGVLRGLANKEIAGTLHLSERTVKFHLSSLLAKFCVRGRMELALAVTRGTSGPMAEPQLFATPDTRTPSAAPPHRGAPPAGRIALANRRLMG
ncbi:MAG TPA: helix-turn-helix transcriptional regulator [Candidatus Dormibacteraeota bacterium]|nr:helix-turn-helix transcriptional regulator [Candidatus Dormibacteraeota bacterium]